MFRGLRVRRTDGDGSPAVTASTVFDAASLSKPVFAYLVMLQVQDNAIDLDKPLDGYLGAPYVPGNALAATITARHVLSHTTGLSQLALQRHPGARSRIHPG
jgi:CubicO group peptidase (beta-lactamase class C family)